METTSAISPADFANNKIGYRKYLVALGMDKEIAQKCASEGFAGYNMNFFDFKKAHVTPDMILAEDEKRLEELNDKWFELTTIQGQDDSNIETDAYHIRVNIRNLVKKIERLEKDG